MTTKVAALLVVLLLLGGAALFYVGGRPPIPQEPALSVEAAGEVTAIGQVNEFGQTLKNVSLLSPDAAQQIRKVYAPYVAPTLLDEWVASTTAAPGRNTSSPWPGYIQVRAIMPQDGKYRILGAIVDVTSADIASQPAAFEPIYMELSNINGTWLITDWQTDPNAQG